LNRNIEYAELLFADNGIGFEQDYAERLFKIFERLHSRKEYEGTGIGLALVKKIVENHRGFIKAESSPGNGAVFSVLLPVQ
jgi:light-regulated signal transduction histidine kinase (bacteriophytochrome)